ncbi:MAG: hypothetical protein WBL93_03870 [Lutisporaceae bacterium]
MNKGLLYKGMILIFALLLITTIALGCTAKQPEPPVPIPSPTPAPPAPPTPTVEERDISLYMPMKVGYIWEYEGEGNEYASYILSVGYEEENRYQLTRDNGGTVIADIYEIREDSIVHVYMSGESYDQTNLLNQQNNLEDIVLKLPLEVGNKWVSEENSYEIIDTKATVIVPYGAFNDCVVVRRTYKDGSEEYMNYKEGVGMLQSEFRTGDFSVFSRLKSFSSK